MTKTNSNKKKNLVCQSNFSSGDHNKATDEEERVIARTKMVGGGGGKFGKVWVENLNKPDQKYFPLSRFFFLVFQILSGVLQVIKFQIFSSRNFSNQIKSMAKVWGAVRFVGVAV